MVFCCNHLLTQLTDIHVQAAPTQGASTSWLLQTSILCDVLLVCSTSWLLLSARASFRVRFSQPKSSRTKWCRSSSSDSITGAWKVENQPALLYTLASCAGRYRPPTPTGRLDTTIPDDDRAPLQAGSSGARCRVRQPQLRFSDEQVPLEGRMPDGCLVVHPPSLILPSLSPPT